MDLAGAPESKKPRWSPNLSSSLTTNGANNATSTAASRPADLFANYGYGNQAAINQPFNGGASLAQQQQQQQQIHNQGIYGAPSLSVNTAAANGMPVQMSPSTPAANSPFLSHTSMPMQQQQGQQGQQMNAAGFGNGFGGYGMNGVMGMGMPGNTGMGGMGMGGMGMLGVNGFPYSPQIGTFQQVRLRH